MKAFFFVALLSVVAMAELQIETTFKPESCGAQAANGNNVAVHYKGMLTDGTVFDESYGRGRPLDFTLGQGRVIAGWEKGILGMCVGEKRKLTIPSDMAYGARGFPPKIPAHATLVFETELVSMT